MTTEIVNAVQDAARLERVVNAETRMLEEMGIKLMESDQFEFAGKTIGEVMTIRHLEVRGTKLPLSLEHNLTKLSLLHSEGRGQQLRLSFIHLTF